MAVSLDLKDQDVRKALSSSAKQQFDERVSLVGLTRAQLGVALSQSGVPGRQVKMRTQQL